MVCREPSSCQTGSRVGRFLGTLLGRQHTGRAWRAWISVWISIDNRKTVRRAEWKCFLLLRWGFLCCVFVLLIACPLNYGRTYPHTRAVTTFRMLVQPFDCFEIFAVGQIFGFCIDRRGKNSQTAQQNKQDDASAEKKAFHFSFRRSLNLERINKFFLNHNYSSINWATVTKTGRCGYRQKVVLVTFVESSVCFWDQKVLDLGPYSIWLLVGGLSFMMWWWPQQIATDDLCKHLDQNFIPAVEKLASSHTKFSNSRLQHHQAILDYIGGVTETFHFGGFLIPPNFLFQIRDNV